jgi:hypothetical protein
MELYTIDDVNELFTTNNNNNEDVYLMNDIDCGNIDVTIGTSVRTIPHFYGKGHKISNLKITGTYLNCYEVYDVTFELLETYMTNAYFLFASWSVAQNVIFKSCLFSNSSKATYGVWLIYANTTKIKVDNLHILNCEFISNSTSTAYNNPALTLIRFSTVDGSFVKNSTFNCKLTSDGNSTVINSTDSSKKATIVSHCIFDLHFEKGALVAPINFAYYPSAVGAGKYIINCYSRSTFNTDEITGDIYPFAFLYSSGIVKDCFYDEDLLPEDSDKIQTPDTNANSRGTGKTTEEMKNKSTYTDKGWVFEDE